MVFNHRSRGPLLLVLNIGTTSCFSDAVSRTAAEVCDEFYDTLRGSNNIGRERNYPPFRGRPRGAFVRSIYTDEQTVLLWFKISLSETYNALRASGIVPQQPVLLHDGWYSNEITAAHEQLSAYMEELAAAGVPYQIKSVTQSYDSNELLTNRQWEFITAAVDQGFYNTPRDCTLTELAETFDINLSAMSRLRHRAESRIIRAFVAEAAL